MINSSKDILLITIAICIAVFTFFSCWGLYYLVGLVRNAFKVSKDARNILTKVEETIDALKDKIHSSSSYLLLIGEAVKKILDIMGVMKGGDGFTFPFGKKKKGCCSDEAEDEEEYEEEDAPKRRKRGKVRNIKVKGKS